MNNKCLNCDNQVKGNFCTNCGQKASTHRYSLQHFFMHDFIHGIFHFDNGFFYTMKELFTRPGHSIREYIAGKRTQHFNYFATVIVLLTLNYFLSKWTKINLADVLNKESTSGLLKVTKDYSKIVVFIVVPLNALMSYLIFRKSKQNYTENLILNIFLLAAIISFRFLLNFAMIVTDDVSFILNLNLIITLFIFVYTAIFFYQYFSAYNYGKINLLIRALIISALFILTKQGVNVLINEIGIRYFH